MRAGGVSVPDIAPWQVRAGLKLQQHGEPSSITTRAPSANPNACLMMPSGPCLLVRAIWALLNDMSASTADVTGAAHSKL